MTVYETRENEEENSDELQAHPEPQRAPRASSGGRWLFVAVLVAMAAGLGYQIHSGIVSRVNAQSDLKKSTEDSAVPYATVTHPKIGAPLQELVLPGNIEAFTATPIYARTSGYLQSWHFDIGAHVKQGQLLAEIEAPEVDKQLQQARAELATADASLKLAQSTAERWQGLLKSNSVSRQETDEKVSDLSVKKATYDSMASNVRRLEDLQSFQRVYAPFDGVITSRNTDTGALIDAGANSTGKELFRLAAMNRLRVFVNVPQVYSRACQPGATAILTLAEFPGKEFRGILARTSNSIDPASRTLLTEIDVDNPTGQLLPGAYVSVHLKLPGPNRSLTIPSNTLLFRSEGLRVGVVRNGRIRLVPITIGRDYGHEVEVVAGLQPADAVITDPADSLVDNTQVRLKASAE